MDIVILIHSILPRKLRRYLNADGKSKGIYQGQMKEELLQDIKGRRNLVITIIISFLTIVTLALTIYMLNDTIRFHQKGFSNEVEYKEDIYFIVKLISCVILGLSALFGPYLYLMNRMFNRYLTLIGTLNSADIIVMDKITSTTEFLYRYWPKVVFKNGGVTFFDIFKETMISFNNVSQIHARDVYRKGYSGLLKIRIFNGEFNYMLKSRNLVTSFLKHAKLVNPNINVERN